MMLLVVSLSILFAVFFALHDIPAINNFTKFGSGPVEQATFHNNSWKMKVLFCTAACFHAKNFWDHIWFFTVAGLVIWLLFDPIIARFREQKKVWYYLSEGNQVDRLLMKYLGKEAGVYKSAFCIIVVTAIILLR